MSIIVLQGDCREVLAGLPASTIDCVIADPPYVETSLDWDRWPDGWIEAVCRVLKSTGSMWCFGSLRMFMDREEEFRDSFRLSHEVIWEKHNGTGLFNDRFRRVHEIAAHFYPKHTKWSDIWRCPQFTNDATARTVRRKSRPAHWIGGTGDTVYRSEDGGPRLARSVQFVRSEHSRAEHPTQKPVGLLQPLIAYACPPDGTVLDPMAGSGSTGIAARIIGRKAILCEADPDYVSLINRRLRDDVPLLREAGE